MKHHQENVTKAVYSPEMHDLKVVKLLIQAHRDSSEYNISQQLFATNWFMLEVNDVISFNGEV